MSYTLQPNGNSNGGAFWELLNARQKLLTVIRRRKARKAFLERVRAQLERAASPPTETSEGDWSFQNELRKQMITEGLLQEVAEAEKREEKEAASLNPFVLADLELTNASDRMSRLAMLMDGFCENKLLPPDVAEGIVNRFVELSRSSSVPLIDVPLVHGGKAKIIGSIAGRMDTLRFLIKTQALPSPSNIYIFNGRYLGAKGTGCQVLLTLFTLKLAFPKYVHILRGCTEDIAHYGPTSQFAIECNKYGKSLFSLMGRAFAVMSFAALVQPPLNLTEEQIALEKQSIEKAMQNNIPYVNANDHFTQYRYPTLVVPGAVPHQIFGQDNRPINFTLNHIRELKVGDDTLFPNRKQPGMPDDRKSSAFDYRVDLTSGYAVSNQDYERITQAYNQLRYANASRITGVSQELLEASRMVRNFSNERESNSFTFYPPAYEEYFVETNRLRALITSNFFLSPTSVNLLASKVRTVSFNHTTYYDTVNVVNCSSTTNYNNENCFGAVIDIDSKGNASFIKYGPEEVAGTMKTPEFGAESRFLERQIIKRLKTLFAIHRMELLEQFRIEFENCPYKRPDYITVEAWSRAIQLVFDVWFESCDSQPPPDEPNPIRFGPTFLQDLLTAHRLLKVKIFVEGHHPMTMVQYRAFLAQFSPFDKLHANAPQTIVNTAMARSVYLPPEKEAEWDDHLNALSTLLAISAKSAETIYNYLDMNGDGEVSIDEFVKGMLCIVKTMNLWNIQISTNPDLCRELLEEAPEPVRPCWPQKKKLITSKKNSTTLAPKPPVEPNPYHRKRKNNDPRRLVLLNATKCFNYWNRDKLTLLATRVDKDGNRTISKTEFLTMFSDFNH